jgi:hypothetical protein
MNKVTSKNGLPLIRDAKASLCYLTEISPLFIFRYLLQGTDCVLNIVMSSIQEQSVRVQYCQHRL